MTIYEILKDMGGKDERIRRKDWENYCWINTDAGRMFFHVVGRETVYPWMPRVEDLLADDWEYWSMPDAASC